MKPENKIRVLDSISPEMREIVDFQASLPQPSIPADDYPAQRRAYCAERRYWNEGGPTMYQTDDLMVSTSWGNTQTRIYRPRVQSEATLFYIHGGGFILGNLDTHDRIMRLLAHYSGCTVIGVDYSLSPEAHFPQAIEEIVCVCQFYSRNARSLSLNMTQIGFAGDSAGAMISLATALWIRNKGIRCGKVSALLLWYGLYGLQDSVSRRLYGGSWDGLTRADLETYEAAYLDKVEERESPYYCLFNNVLTEGIAPCFIASAQYDPLLDDSEALYKTLQAHGQPCCYRMYSGTLHAFLHYSRRMPIADEAIRDGAHYFILQLKG